MSIAGVIRDEGVSDSVKARDLTPNPVEVARRFGSNGLGPVEIPGIPAPAPAPAAAAPSGAKPEGAPAAPAPGEKQEPQMSARFAALAKKEKEVRAQAARVKEAEAKLKAFEERESAYRADPMKLLQDFGHTYQGLTERILNDGNPTPAQVAQAVNKDIQAIRSDLQRRDQEAAAKAAQARTQAEAEAVAGFREEVNDFVKAEPDTYELINLYGQQGLVFDTVEAHYKETGKMLSLKDAADKVEQYLWDEAQKVTQTKRFQAAARPTRRVPSPGVSHRMAPQPQPDPNAGKLLSEEERKARALQAIAPFFPGRR